MRDFFMTVYIEYVFLENCLLDGVILLTSFCLCRVKTRWYRIFFSSAIGGAFAVIFPIFCLANSLKILLKISVGLCMCLLAYPRLKTKAEWRKFVFFCGTFFFATFLYGGALTAFLSMLGISVLSVGWIATGFAFVTLALLLFGKKLYQKRVFYGKIYPCKILYGGREKRVSGYMDSGNLAQKNGLPVCFLSVDIFYDLWGQEVAFFKAGNTKCEGQVCDEMEITTMGGVKRIPLYQGELQIKTGEKIQKYTVYFSPSKNMIQREYALLLNAQIGIESE